MEVFFIFNSKKLVKCLFVGIVTILILSAVSAAFIESKINTVEASSASSGWFYSDSQFRQADDLTNNQTSFNFYSLSSATPTLAGNPSAQHAFQPVHSSTIQEVDKRVDNNTWKYLA